MYCSQNNQIQLDVKQTKQITLLWIDVLLKYGCIGIQCNHLIQMASSFLLSIA